MPQITLPDGSKREFDHPVSVMDVARDIHNRNRMIELAFGAVGEGNLGHVDSGYSGDPY